MTDDDEGAVRVLGALCDRPSLQLLLHVLETGECDSTVGRQLDMPSAAAAARLDRLVDAGLMVRTQPQPGRDRYRISDALLVERLLATVRQLGARDRDT